MEFANLTIKVKDKMLPVHPDNMIIELDGTDVTDKTFALEVSLNVDAIPTAKIEFYINPDIQELPVVVKETTDVYRK